MSDKNARPTLKEHGYATSIGKEKELEGHFLNRLEAGREEQERLLEEESFHLVEEARRLAAESDEGRREEKVHHLRAELERLSAALNKWTAGGELVVIVNKPTHKKKRARAKLSRPAGPRTVARAAFALELLADAVPKRINTEQIGDALERIHQLAAKGGPKWVIYFKVVTTYWWVFWNTLLHYGERVAGIVQVAIGKGDNKE